METKNETVRKIAKLIQKNPAITVEELAKALGFAQERSIYYWLGKAQYSGIKEFKRAVLATPTTELNAGESDSPNVGRGVASVPLWSADKRLPDKPYETEGAPAATFTTHLDVGPRAFALSIDSLEYAPLIRPADILLVDPDEAWRDGDVVLVRFPDRGHMIRHVYGPDPVLLVHPTNGGNWLRAKLSPERVSVIGKVVQLVREY